MAAAIPSITGHARGSQAEVLAVARLVRDGDIRTIVRKTSGAGKPRSMVADARLASRTVRQPRVLLPPPRTLIP